MHASELASRLGSRLRTSGAEPVSHLIIDEVWLAVVEGALEVGQRLPTTRQLAIALGVAPRSIERAYEELQRRGVIVTRQGAGTFVSLTPGSEEDRARREQFVELCAEAVRRAADLGFTVHELIDELTEYRSTGRETPTEEPGT